MEKDLIVYGIIAAAVIINIIKSFNKEKAKSAQRTTASQTPPPTLFVPTSTSPTKNMQGKTLFGKPQPVAKKAVEKYPNQSSAIHQTPKNDVHSYVEMENYSYETADNTIQEYTIADNTTNNTSIIDLKNNSELRKAILHSIILERKYTV